MSQLPDTSPESLLHGAPSMNSVSAQRRIDAITRAVARIDFADQDSGTGVVLGGRWLLTCHHVVPSLERARQVKAIIFGFERDPADQLQGGVSVQLAPKEGFHTDQADDWTLIRLAADARLASFGHAQLFDDCSAQPGDSARIVQHPGAREKCSAEGSIVSVEDDRIRYRINTEGGTSGAPVINREGKIIALHHQGADNHNQGVAIQRVVAGIRGLGGDLWTVLSQAAPPLTQPQPQQQRLAATRLVTRHTAADFLGRDNELDMLDRVWRRQDGLVNLFSLIAWGGVGKTALLAHWVQSRFTAQGWRNADGQPDPIIYFDWTFYDQGTRSADSEHAGAASLGSFFQVALKHFGDPEPDNPQDKVHRLASLIQAKRTLLILDGLEPLQYPPNHPQAGQLTDPDLSELLGRLAQLNLGLCLISSRQALSDLPANPTGPTREHPLDELPPQAAVALLQRLDVKGTDEELAQAANDYFCHALSLTVLGRYLALKGGDIRQRDRIKLETASANRNQRITRNAWHVLEAYEQWLASPEGNAADAQALRLAGLFDRPASPGCLDALRQAPAIPGLTDALVPLNNDAWNAVLMRLHEAQLLQLRLSPNDPASWAPRPEPRQVALDAHPLIREYFAKRLRAHSAEAFKAAHARLFDYLCKTTEHRPDTLEGLQPLYQAVSHGCLAGRQDEAREKVYVDRILRGTGKGGFYSRKKLGAFGADLGAVGAFFDSNWSRLSPNLDESTQAWLLNEAAYSLRALGRLNEAREPMLAGLEMRVKAKNWEQAAISASNLSGLEVTLGLLGEAVASARRAIAFANKSGNAFQRMTKRVTAADALHQSGAPVERTKARGLFEQAVSFQREDQPGLNQLYGVAGFYYCDLILAPAERGAWRAATFQGDTNPDAAPARQALQAVEANAAALTSLPLTQQGGYLALKDVERRAKKSLEWVTPEDLLLDIALDHLTLARVALYRALLFPNPPSATRSQYLQLALDGLHKAGQVQFHLQALLTAALHQHSLDQDTTAARRCLDEAQQIAERGPMPLYLADVHLHRARLFHDKVELDKARALIKKHGYGRRSEELADAEQAARFW